MSTLNTKITKGTSPHPSISQLVGTWACSFLKAWHLLSLDAPTVAAVWTAFVAWSIGLAIPRGDVAAMFLAVFMLYATDRLLDAKPLFTLPLLPELQPRHLFHHRHRSTFLAATLICCVPLAVLLHHTPESVLHLYVALACLLFGWLLLIHVRPAPSAIAHRLPKEVAVGLFFPAAVFISTVGRVPGLRASLLPLALLFASVCILNCLFLYAWEHPGHPAEAHASTRWGLRRMRGLALGSTVAALGLLPLQLARRMGPFGERNIAHLWAPCAACAMSAGLLLLLDQQRERISPLLLRALADFVLLTPVPVGLATVLTHRVR